MVEIALRRIITTAVMNALLDLSGCSMQARPRLAESFV
jgi:hypothetical protein